MQDAKERPHEAVLEDFPDLSQYQVYACGNPLMVRRAKVTYPPSACSIRTTSSPTRSFRPAP
jgi:hypothetical protein